MSDSCLKPMSLVNVKFLPGSTAPQEGSAHRLKLLVSVVFTLSFLFTLDPSDFLTLIPHVSVSFFVSPFLFTQASMPWAVALLPTMYSDNESELSEPDTVVSMFNEDVFMMQYTMLETLGESDTSDMRLCSHHLKGTPVAFKALLKREKWLEPTMLEV